MSTPLAINSLSQAQNAQLGINLPVMYGNCRVTGDNVLLQELSTKHKIANYILGERLWDGIERLWINEVLVDITDTSLVHFHPGLLGTLGAGLTPSSTGGDQGVDSFFSSLPSNFQPLTYSGMANLWLNVPPDPKAPTADLQVIGDYRTSKCRIFDSSGNQTSFAFTTNGAWQALDAILRSMIKPEWDPAAAAAVGGDLTTAEKARINWPAVVAAAAACDHVLANGQKRFESSVAFVTKITLQQALKQLLMMSQLYITEDSGQIYIMPDQARASTFTLTRDHVLAGTASFDKKNLRGAPNRLVATYFDTNPQNSADIDTVANSGIVRAANVVTVKTKQQHPYLVNDNVQIVEDPAGGGPDSSFLGVFTVTSVPDSTHFTFNQTGANLTSGGGYTGTPESRFVPGSGLEDHEAHQNALGVRGIGLTRSFRRLEQSFDFGNNTYERTKRLLRFMLNRNLGIDGAPYNAPWSGTIRANYLAVDDAGNMLAAQLDGDIITIDSTISEEYQGDCEIMNRVINRPALDGSGGGSSSDAASASGDSSEMTTVDLTLLQYLPTAFDDPVFLANPVRSSISRGGISPVVGLDVSGVSSDGLPIIPGARQLVRNGDLGIYTAPGGIQSAFASSVRANDFTNDGVTIEQSPNGWTRNFESAGNGEGVTYRSNVAGFQPGPGQWCMVMQDRHGSVNDQFSDVSDAFAVNPAHKYRVQGTFFPGNAASDPHQAWYFRVFFYKAGATDFSRFSASLCANSPTIEQGSNLFNSAASAGIADLVVRRNSTGLVIVAATVTPPSDAAFARVAVYHWNDGTATTAVWNLLYGNIRCEQIITDNDSQFTISSPLNNQGSIVPGQSLSLSFGTTTTTIAISWSSASLLRADGSSLSVPSGSKNYSSLTATNTYWLYPYINASTGVISFANGDPPPTGTSHTFAIQAALDGRMPLVPFSVTLPSSGTGSGTGGDGTCPDSGELVETRERGLIKAADVQFGEYIKGYCFHAKKDVFRRVIGVGINSCAAWRIVNGHKVSPCEPVCIDLESGQWIGASRVPGAPLDTSIGIKMDIVVEADEFSMHNYWLVSGDPLLIHNPVLPRS